MILCIGGWDSLNFLFNVSLFIIELGGIFMLMICLCSVLFSRVFWLMERFVVCVLLFVVVFVFVMVVFVFINCR